MTNSSKMGLCLCICTASLFVAVFAKSISSKEQPQAFILLPLNDVNVSNYYQARMVGAQQQLDKTRTDEGQILDLSGLLGGKDQTDTEDERGKKVQGSGSPGDDGERASLNPLLRAVIVEIQKQFAAKQPGFSLYGAIQRATGDFWLFLANSLNSIGAFGDLLVGPLIAPLQALVPPTVGACLIPE